MKNYIRTILLMALAAVFPSSWAPGNEQTTEGAKKLAHQEFVSNLVIGYSQVAQWYEGFESIVEDDRWELLVRGGAGVDKWSDPNFDGWSRPIRSACRVRSGDPDRVVLSISGPYGENVDLWAEKIEASIENIRAKYKNVQQVVLQPVVGGPDHQRCPAPNGRGFVRASWQHAYIDQAIDRVVKADKKGQVVAGPSPEVRSCNDYRDALGHLTPEASAPIGRTIGQFYAR